MATFDPSISLIFNIGAFGLPPARIFPTVKIPLTLSDHAIEEIATDRFGDYRKNVPKELNLWEELQKGNIVECEVHKGSGKLTKVIVRHSVGDVDIVLVVAVNPRRTGNQLPSFVNTCWCNHGKDKHDTLQNKEKFSKPGQYWR